MLIDRGEDFVVVNKPAGYATHQVDVGHPGWQELVQKSLDLPLFVVHRLDKGTTGVLIFALTSDKAKQLSESFAQRTTQKRYLFVTRSSPALEADGGELRTHTSVLNAKGLLHKTPATTRFQRVKLNALFQLWEAWPETGQTHQIRIHAAELGMPIVGDTEYGGAAFPHLCLHAAELEIPGIGRWSAPPPPFFDRMGLLRDSEVCGVLSAADRRQRIFNFLENKEQSIRVSHLESSVYRVDIFGEVLWLYWYADFEPSPRELQKWHFIAGFLGKKLFVRTMENRGKNPTSKSMELPESPVPPTWTFKERDFLFQGRRDTGLSPGLFLDQRENRQWVKNESFGLRVLNLFAYTCGFSVAAALGQAKQVTSVDLSSNFLDWGKENFKLNSLDPSQYEFYAMDSQRFLKSAFKNKKTWDLIILDPPSFSRSKEGVWRIDKNLGEIVNNCLDILSPRGRILLSTNFEKWTLQDLRENLAKNLDAAFELSQPSLPCLDFELPKEQVLMKYFVLSPQKPQRERNLRGH
jgi:23S rRNA (cytosine1962-C5)-methyltransferase